MSYTFKYRKYAEALYHALVDDAFYITMEKSVDNGSAIEAMFRYMDYSMIEARNYGELFIPSDHDYGVSIWSKPVGEEAGRQRDAKKKEFLIAHMGESSLQTYNSIVVNMSAETEKVVEDHWWYLSIVGLLPEYQGKGLGAGLLEEILAEADRQHIPTYLETFTPRNMSFYSRLGYEAVKQIHEPTTDADYWVMVRQPDIS